MIVNKWQHEHKEEYNAYRKKWYAKNKDKMKKYIKAYREKNLEKIRKQLRDQYYKHKERRALEKIKNTPAIEKRCVICDTKFETRTKRKVCCSDVCQKKRYKQLVGSYYKQNKDKLREYKKNYAREHYGVKNVG